MTSPSPDRHSAETTLKRYFTGVAEQTFQTQLGVANPTLIDYVSDLLIRFVRMESVQRVRDPSGNRLQQLGSMLREAEARIGDAKRAVHRHIGDYALFWAGLFPESLRQKVGDDGYQVYCVHGKHAYRVASRIESDTMPPSEVLEQLSEEFELCAYGLLEVRKELNRRDDNGDGGDGDLPCRLLLN
ncbi:MAG: hypothetical protein KDB14_18240 [Planctomycetales bacterium]|nr:hypothetical protein [Planctomycetales bacterium]